HVTAVEDLAGRLEADPGAGRDLLDRHVAPPGHRVLPPVLVSAASSELALLSERSLQTLDPPAMPGQVGVSKMFRPRYPAAISHRPLPGAGRAGRVLRDIGYRAVGFDISAGQLRFAPLAASRSSSLRRGSRQIPRASR